MRHRVRKTVMPASSDATELLLAWSNGDESAFDKLVTLVYQELRLLAQRYMRRERSDHTLQATALVNEAYVRLIDANRIQWQNRAHFLAVAATTMRRILVEFARHNRREKRGGDAVRVTIDDALEVPQERSADLVALSDALSTLSTLDERMSQVVELRFFGGLSVQETADVLHVSPETVMRDWKTAKAWLLRELSHSSSA
jgi:RNA polymerase sigma factor (TIGR02999 family)